jgi:1,4-alpha-glucan branching enzyme
MKQILILVTIAFFISCKTEMKKEELTQTKINSMKPISDEALENAVIYEANIRQYSPEGKFSNFIQDIPKLKELGVKIIWVMPIYPISNTKSKGSLGSYYAITDYTGVNPEFGTLEDVKTLVRRAHENGMYVILDWVANHTGWDHRWLKEHPDYYTKDANGQPIYPKGTDWTDVADLNYDNTEMRAEMLKDMIYWINQADIDGFRCDVAGMVPIDFWENTVTELKKIKPVFMLAEAWEPDLMKNAFDMEYNWDLYHILNDIAQGKANIHKIDERMHRISEMYQKDDIMMNFLTNHDENSWNGTVKERLGDAANAMLALTYCAPGMPLIYSGQEYDLSKRLRFFEKDTISKVKGHTWELMKKLGNLKNNNVALHGGKQAASYSKITTSEPNNVLVIERAKENKKVIYVANLSNHEVSFTMNLSGKFLDYFSHEKLDLKAEQNFTFKPWEYKILIP